VKAVFEVAARDSFRLLRSLLPLPLLHVDANLGQTNKEEEEDGNSFFFSQNGVPEWPSKITILHGVQELVSEA
jgi:hypothetical protein